MTTAIYPGSFDTITNGHLDIIKRAAGIFDTLIVGILTNSAKTPAFSVSERIDFINRSLGGLKNVKVCAFSGLLVDFARAEGAKVIVKGLRALADFEYEFQMALVNKSLNDDIETMFMMTNNKYSFISSSIVREIASLSGDISSLVPDEIALDILKKFKKA